LIQYTKSPANAEAEVLCRGCGSDKQEVLGELPDGAAFAGIELTSPIPGGSLFRCHHCALVYRHPILAVEEYNQLYAQAPTDVWAGQRGPLREDQERVRDFILSHRSQGARVLDVGCYTGELLASLGPKYEKFGIEKSLQAAARCADAGITIIGDDLYDCRGVDDRFDVVVAMDVIEHTARPYDFMETAIRLLAPGGVAVITTGDADNPVWRRVKSAFWYCSFPEHISFISEEWLSMHTKALGIQKLAIARFPYYRQPRWKVFVKRFLVRLYLLFGVRGKPMWSAHISHDHILAVLER
jgi:2-polyprenyl-3-methyl-5-hydroxy-6-metoxy-1,4-benzoquinol methylase